MAIRHYELVGESDDRPFSPHCWKSAFALAHKGLAFERVPTRFTEIAEVENGVSKTIPVLRDGEKVVSDSFAIALYLEETYPDRPTLFGGEGGKAAARFVERWVQASLNPYVIRAILGDIHAQLHPLDRAYFRQDREARFGRKLEEVGERREAGLEAFRAALAPLRDMLGFQAFIGGAAPLFADYIVAGAFQFARVTSPFALLAGDDPVAAWFDRCLDLHEGLGRSVLAAASPPRPDGSSHRRARPL